MKKILILVVLVVSLSCKNVLAETFSRGPVAWTQYYYTRIDNNTGELQYSYLRMFKRNSDNRLVYCIEPGVEINYGVDYPTYDNNQASVANISEEVFEKISLMAYFGYGYNDEVYHHGDPLWWAATQWMIWQEANNNHTIYFTLNQNYTGTEPRIERFTDEITELNYLINLYYKKPNIILPEEIEVGDTITISDSNNVLKYYEIESCSNCEATIDNNSITITAINTGDLKINIKRVFDQYNSDPLVYVREDAQNLMAAGNIKNIYKSYTTKVIGKRLTVNKMDDETKSNVAQENASLSGAIYGIYNLDDELIEQIVTDDVGIAISNYLSLGDYYLQEIKASDGYELDLEKYYFSITIEDEAPTITVYEKIKREEKIEEKEIIEEQDIIEELKPLSLEDNYITISVPNTSHNNYYAKEFTLILLFLLKGLILEKKKI